MTTWVNLSDWEAKAAEKWGPHPMEWPYPPKTMPGIFQFNGKHLVKELETVFGPLHQSDFDRYWAEVRKGQSVYEDAGGYMIRCYAAMMGEPTQEPYTYQQAADDLIKGETK